MEFIIPKGTGNDGELAQYCNCFRNNDMEKELEMMQWLHQQNLVQENTIYYAYDDDNIAAIYTAIPVYFKVKKITQSLFNLLIPSQIRNTGEKGYSLNSQKNYMPTLQITATSLFTASQTKTQHQVFLAS